MKETIFERVNDRPLGCPGDRYRDREGRWCTWDDYDDQADVEDFTDALNRVFTHASDPASRIANERAGTDALLQETLNQYSPALLYATRPDFFADIFDPPGDWDFRFKKTFADSHITDGTSSLQKPPRVMRFGGSK